MTIDELIEAAKNRPVTEVDVEAFAKRLKETEAEFAEELSSWYPDAAWLNRTYGE